MSHIDIKKLLQIALVSGVLATTVGCGNAQSVKGSAVGGSHFDAQSPEIEEIHSKLDNMEVEVFNVTQEMSALDLQNPLKLLGGSLKDSVKKFSSVVKDARSKVDELKLKINLEMAKLDLNNPQHRKLLAKLKEAQSYLNQVDAHLDEVVLKLESKIDALFAKLERKIALLGPIQSIVAKLALNKLQDSILKHLTGA